jgi:hypothetical protein
MTSEETVLRNQEDAQCSHETEGAPIPLVAGPGTRGHVDSEPDEDGTTNVAQQLDLRNLHAAIMVLSRVRRDPLASNIEALDTSCARQWH